MLPALSRVKIRLSARLQIFMKELFLAKTRLQTIFLPLRLRFGLEDGRSRTLEEVGQQFNVTRERIRQIEAKALRKLRHPNRSNKVRDYLD